MIISLARGCGNISLNFLGTLSSINKSMSKFAFMSLGNEKGTLVTLGAGIFNVRELIFRH
jgi:hypothetical protein